MTEAAITVDDLRKTYRVGDGTSGGYRLLRDVIADRVRRWRLGAATPRPSRVHHALDGVSLTIGQGEVLGIIGANGAGKSTLLKILSRITEPTAGRCLVRGRVGALLEVGTGFNPELSGRENVYINGAILGMSRREIRTKFDEIVDFAGIASYIDTPVKRYSSGMQVRLAFAVAAHLEPEIMIVDEVLAVGDAAFQRRCLGRMNEVAKGGRTVLFVSHNMEPMLALCSRVVWLDRGRVRMDGPAAPVVQAYLADSVSAGRSSTAWRPVAERNGNGAFHFTGCRVLDAKGLPVDPVMVGDEVRIEVDFRTEPPGQRNGSLRMWLRNADGREPVLLSTTMTGDDMGTLPPQGRLVCRIKRFPVGPGTYSLRLVGVLGQELSDEVDPALVFDVAPGDYYQRGNSLSEYVSFLVDHDWHLERPAEAATRPRLESSLVSGSQS